MNERYIIITSAVNSHFIDFIMVHSPTQVLHEIDRINNPGALDDMCDVKSVFKIDQYGAVTHLALQVQNFKFKLVELPEEEKSR